MIIGAREIAADAALQCVCGIVEAAATAIRGVYSESSIDHRLKEDLSPLTQADLISHRIICDRLSENFDLPVLSEESPVEYSQRRSWAQFWLVDPLDGTKDFLARDDEFTVNVALIDGHEPILGVLAAPALRLVYYAVKGCGAFKLCDGKTTRIAHLARRTELIGAESRFHSAASNAEFCQRHRIQKMIQIGSALKLGLLAEGEIDVYPRFEPTKEWDTAAGHCILNEGGCKLIDCATGRPLLYNKPNIVNGPFIASAAYLDFVSVG